MLVTFKTKAHADIIVFGDVALKLIQLMGHSGTIPSALKPEEVPTALDKLKSAIQGGADMPHKDNAAASEESGAKSEDGDEAHVSLRTRALPLIELLEAAKTQNQFVMWEN